MVYVREPPDDLGSVLSGTTRTWRKSAICFPHFQRSSVVVITFFARLSWDMPAGLHLIFDKSAIQSFSVDETNWLDHFYTTVITPLFYAEVLADLEKQVSTGKTPEQVVGALAHKTPD